MNTYKPERKYFLFVAFILVLLAILATIKVLLFEKSARFDGEQAMKYLEYQVNLGPRTIGSQAHKEITRWVIQELSKKGWKVTLLTSRTSDVEMVNILAKRGKGTPWIILGAHYDSRLFADRDPDPQKRKLPVPGANDGASGVALLMELGHVLPRDLDKQIWLVFFDAEDNGRINGYDWIMGSRSFVKELSGKPDAAVIVDMVADKDLNIFQEGNSNVQLVKSIWEQAAILGYNQFIPTLKHTIIDDHIPFLEAGIPAIDIIDFDYPYWHTTGDTLDKVSSRSMQAVGDTLFSWLVQ